MEITSTCQPKLRQLKKNPLVESNHIYSYRTPMRLAMGTWFLYWSVNLRWVQKQEENWKAESISLGKSLGRLVVKVPSFVSKMLRFGWLQITCAWRCSWIFFFQILVAWVWRRRRKRLEMVVLKIVDSLVLVYFILHNLFFDMNFARIFIFCNVLPKSTDRNFFNLNDASWLDSCYAKWRSQSGVF